MIDELQVQNIALIPQADIEFSSGLNVLTGETGAGKTALLSALKLILGQRADSKMVRDGCSEAFASARLILDDEEHIASRRLSENGRSKCKIDGEMATVGELASLGASVHIHSQSEQVQLLQASKQRSYLDAWISRDCSHLQDYTKARDEFLEADKAYTDLQNASNAKENELEYLRFTLQEIEKVNPKRGEYEQLESELPRLQHGESLATACESALNLIYDDNSALDYLAQALQSLQRVAGIDEEIDNVAARLEALESELSDIARDLSAVRENISFDPQILQETLERLDAISGLIKRFGPDIDTVLQTREKAHNAIEAACASPQHLQQAKQKRDDALKAYKFEAQKLSKVRHSASGEFCLSLQESLQELAMPDATFEFEFEDLPLERWNAYGSEHIELLYSPGKNMKLRPLSHIASGGELSRILLALECLHKSEGETFIFDEVDQGIGGQTGRVVAQRLHELSKSAQVIVISHLAQVAARADKHFLVNKTKDENGSPITQVEAIDGQARVKHIAYMLAGNADEAACAHAKELLEEEL